MTKMTIEARKKYKKAMKSAKKNMKNKNYKEAARDIDEAITCIKEIDDALSHNMKDDVATNLAGFVVYTVSDTLEYFLILFPLSAITGSLNIAMIPVAALTIKKYIDNLNYTAKKLMTAKKDSQSWSNKLCR